MKKILFSHSYFYQYDHKQWKMRQPFPPLMTITAAALMRKAGYEVHLFDTNLKESEEGLENMLADIKPDFFFIFDDGFNYLNKMCLTNMREAAFRMQQKAKNFGTKVITCSSDSTDHFLKYLQQSADFVIKGEGEITLKELVTCIDSAGNINDVKGLTYLNEDGELIETPRRQVNNDLDQLPQAAWDLVDVDAYRKVWGMKDQLFYLNVATTRGCPYKCNWCAKPIYGQRYHSRSPEKVVDEIEWLSKTYKVSHFWMCDDIFALKPKWGQDFNEELQRRNLKIKYKIQSRADLLLQEDNIYALVKSGLDEAWMGAESGSQKILDAMEKGTKIEQIENATNILKSNGVKVGFFIQFGYPGETKNDIRKTFDLVLRLMPERLGISVSYPLPGTKFYENVKSQLNKKANWLDSDDLDLMFHNTFPKQYYKILHRLLHGVYGLKKAKNELTRNAPLLKLATIKNILKVPYHSVRNILLRYKLVQIEKNVPSV